MNGRHLARKLTDILGQSVLIDNRGGANVMIGADIYVLSPEEFGKFLQSEIRRWKGVVAKYKLEL
ncbi:MAG: tripartite tricarboxylate transporter substrate-binding protein [Burkholderiales bacterium]|nr:tripartite tricarboxylate transporter substrate-binding protein [Burkholderiales bacterium]